MSARLVECFTHGLQEEAFVCAHILESFERGETPGFVCYPGPDDAFPDAWCDKCEELVGGNGGEWTDGLSRKADIKMLCASCYVSARDLAERDGRLKVFM